LIINQQRFLRKESCGSNLTKNSKERIEKLIKLQIGYNEYLERNEGFYIMKFQLEYFNLSQCVKSGLDLEKQMRENHQDYVVRSRQLFQDIEF
jgi:hypothetical protein